jgi:hypothetical protein
MPAQHTQNNNMAGPSSRPAQSQTSNRTGNNNGSKRSRQSVGNINSSNLAPPAIQERTNSSTQDPLSYTAPAATAAATSNSTTNPNPRSVYNAPPSSSSSHPSLPLPYGGAAPNGIHVYDLSHPSSTNGPDWAAHPVHGQLEGPGMPVARGQSHTPMSLAGTTAALAPLSTPMIHASGLVDSAPVDGGEGEGDGDDKTYCFCDGVSYGEMIACDDLTCEREWVRLLLVFFAFFCERLNIWLVSSTLRVLH